MRLIHVVTCYLFCVLLDWYSSVIAYCYLCFSSFPDGGHLVRVGQHLALLLHAGAGGAGDEDARGRQRGLLFGRH